jgi:hypothetical protein
MASLMLTAYVLTVGNSVQLVTFQSVLFHCGLKRKYIASRSDENRLYSVLIHDLTRDLGCSLDHSKVLL